MKMLVIIIWHLSYYKIRIIDKLNRANNICKSLTFLFFIYDYLPVNILLLIIIQYLNQIAHNIKNRYGIIFGEGPQFLVDN